GPKKAELFNKLGIYTVLDLLYYLPRKYEDRRTIKKVSQCYNGEVCCIKIIPTRQIIEKRLKAKLSLFILYAHDGEEAITIKWFSAPFARPKLKSRTEYIVYGRMTENKGGKEFELRCIEPANEMKYTGTIIPIYPSTNGINSKTISEAVKTAYLSSPRLLECFPENIVEEYMLSEINSAIYNLHNPYDFASLETSRRRLAFEELFVLQLALFRLKNIRKEKKADVIFTADKIREFASFLPFELTEGQKMAINDICADLKSGKAMNRLIQGDVGCGKTAVACAVIYGVCKNGYQAVFMAPTEILAQQHYKNLDKIFDGRLRIALLTSSVKNKSAIIEGIKNGEYDLVIGTHAVLEDNVVFNNLILSITDEQHRFGVNQRAMLNSKGENVHVLVMSATPIPRTLSLILYGDVDVSVIKSKPFGRQKIETFHVNSQVRQRAYGFLRKEIESGKQAYVVCPLVEESENFDAASVNEIYEEVTSKFLNGLRVAVIHGKMKAAEKDRVMSDFKSGKTDVLVSTTVIEVGVDVPNASVMLIENAERFGLSQLHQLRGRVGRGSEKSYCILVSDCNNENSEKRMKIMTSTDDGFEISAKDLELRGSGEFFGTRQHGLPELKVANLFSDIDILKEVQKAAIDAIEKDPGLDDDKWVFIKSRIDNLFSSLENDNIFN
ncbi:MAG: ATP-dependent DNA helicase RecG, partial [Clostridia bacterium]|nr:ATP-dependent DNA helicase RecG [Clostridia bacterium]